MYYYPPINEEKKKELYKCKLRFYQLYQLIVYVICNIKKQLTKFYNKKVFQKIISLTFVTHMRKHVVEQEAVHLEIEKFDGAKGFFIIKQKLKINLSM